MTDYAWDGTPLTLGTSREHYALAGEHAHWSILGQREMVVLRCLFIDSPENVSKRFVEYVCRDIYTGEELPRCRLVASMGGVVSGDDNVLHPATSLLPGVAGVTGATADNVPSKLSDGDQVLVGFVEGSRSRPVIFGVLPHSGSSRGAKASDGERRLLQHKGTTVIFSSTGEYTVTHKSGAYVKLLDDGSVEVVPAGGKQIRLGDSSLNALLDGLVHGRGIDPFTGASYAVLGNASTVVLGKKG